jgi:uncharacterized membrane protein (DUF485 family)
MSTPTGHQTTARPPGIAPERAQSAASIDWRHIANTPEFQALHRSRRRFTLAGMAIETGALLVVMGLYGWAPDAMGKPAVGSITWGLIALTFVMAWAYARKARDWEEMSARALAHSERPAEPTGRFAR